MAGRRDHRWNGGDEPPDGHYPARLARLETSGTGPMHDLAVLAVGSQDRTLGWTTVPTDEVPGADGPSDAGTPYRVTVRDGVIEAVDTGEENGAQPDDGTGDD